MTEDSDLGNPVTREQHQSTDRGGLLCQRCLVPTLVAETPNCSSRSLQQSTDRTTESSFEGSCLFSGVNMHGSQATESQPTTVETGPNVLSDCQRSNSHHGNTASQQDEFTEEQNLNQKDMGSTVRNDIQGIDRGDTLDPMGQQPRDYLWTIEIPLLATINNLLFSIHHNHVSNHRQFHL